MTVITPSGRREYAPTPTEKNRSGQPAPLDEGARRAQPDQLPQVLRLEGRETGRHDIFTDKGTVLDEMV